MRLREASTSKLIEAGMIFLLSLAGIVWFANQTQGRLLWSVILLAFAVNTHTFAFALRQWFREIVIDDEGCKLLDRGRLQWAISWGEFGGYLIPRERIVVLDRSGRPVGSSVFERASLSAFRSKNCRVFIRELDRRLPEGGFRPKRPGPPPPPKLLTTPARCLAFGVFGAAITACGFYGLNQMLRGAREGDAARGLALWLGQHEAFWPILAIPVLVGPTMVIASWFSWRTLQILAARQRAEDKNRS